MEALKRKGGAKIGELARLGIWQGAEIQYLNVIMLPIKMNLASDKFDWLKTNHQTLEASRKCEKCCYKMHDFEMAYVVYF